MHGIESVHPKACNIMLSSTPDPSGSDDLFRHRLENIIDLSHDLIRLSRLIDWEGLEQDFSAYYCSDNGRPGAPIRLMTGLLFLKELKGLSDEEVCNVWCENPYFQYFCGETFFQHRFPVEPPSLSIFRKRIKESGMQRLLEETVKLGLSSQVIHSRDLSIITVDTTVQEKAVRFPTDSRLCDKARFELVKLAFAHDVSLRQSYKRKSKYALFMGNRYASARQMKRARNKVKEVKNYLGRVIRDIERKIANNSELEGVFADSLKRAKVIYNQALNPKAKDKCYSWHAPEVECIAKGKAHKRYEFGCKMSIAATNKNNFILGAMAHQGNPYDGHTLKDVLNHVQSITGIKPKEVQADQGYKGHGIEDEEMEIILAKQKRGITPAKKKRQKRRNAIEPIIGHCKNDRKTGPRNYLKGEIGDKINALAIAMGFNLRKILQHLLWTLFWWEKYNQNKTQNV